MPLRTVTGTIRRATGDPWEDFTVTFTLTPSTSTLEASYPHDALTAVTDVDGAFSVDLVTDVRYQVALTTLLDTANPRGADLRGALYSIVVPNGDGAIALERLRLPERPDLPIPRDLLDAVIESVAARLIPPGGVTGQALVKAADGDYSLAWGTADAHYSEG